MAGTGLVRRGHAALVWVLAGFLIASLPGCPDDGLSLTVDVQTGLVPGREFGFVSVEIESGASPRVVGRPVELGAAGYREGVRFATFDGLAPGIYTVRGFLRRAPAPGGPADGAAILVERRVITSLSNDRVITIALSSDCIAVECPAPAGSAAFSECLNGRCVDPRCDPGDPSTHDAYCCDVTVDDCSQPTVCGADGDCDPIASCVGVECIAGACIEEAEDSCPGGSYCSRTTLMCEGAPVMADAGIPDAAFDAADPCFGLICPFACFEGECRGPEWVVSQGTGSAENIVAVGEDHVVTGSFEGALRFEGCPELTATSGNDIFLARFDDVGICQWAFSFGSDGGDAGRGIAADVVADRIYVTGTAGGVIDFGGGPHPALGGGSDVFVAAFAASSGAHVWSWIGGTALGSEGGAAIAIDRGPSSPEIVVVSSEQSGLGRLDIGLRRFTEGGSALPSVAFGGPLDDEAAALVLVPGASGSRSDVVMLGVFSDTADFNGPTPGGVLTASGEAGGVVARYDGSGALEWLTPVHGDHRADLFAVALAGARIMVGGALRAEVAPGVFDRTAIVAWLDAATGVAIGGTGFGIAGVTSEMDDTAAAIAIDERGTIHLAGLASGAWTFAASSVGADNGACPLGCENPMLAHLESDGTPRAAMSRASTVEGVEFFRSLVTDGDRDFVAGTLEGRVHIEAIRLRP